MTHHIVDVAIIVQKIMVGAKGERDFKVYQKEFRARVKVLKEAEMLEGTYSWHKINCEG